MNKKYVKKHDFSRIILTELFPYEVPIVFDVEGWKKFCSNGNKIFKKAGDSEYYIPFNYEIKKGNNEFRTLSLIHPLQCSDFIDFYKQYGTYILYLCNKQPKISLRFPSRITNAYYSEEAKHHSGEAIEIDEPEKELIEYVGFFSYKKFDRLHKFYKSVDYQRYEKKFRHCFVCDISKCFYSMYTHTISWAVKSQEIAKTHRNTQSFDSKFDRLMQRANYNETHGIIVGPEVSRIFAEIILQKIDGNLVQELQKNDCVIDRDYIVRRYIDDYFVYYNDEAIFSHIYRVLQKCLLEYKLSINESKSEHLENPFITSNTIVKSLLSSIISEGLKTDKIEKIKFHHGQKIITQIKATVKTYSVPYSSIVNYLLAVIDGKILEFVSEKKVSVMPQDSLYQSLEALFSVYFFLYNMDIRVDTSYKLAKRILETLKELSTIEGLIDDFVQFIVKELEQCFDRIKNIGTIKNVTIECINYIYTLLAIQNFCKGRNKNISFEYHFDKLFFNKEKGSVSREYFLSFNYFEIIVFIHTYKDHEKKMNVLKGFLLEYFRDKRIEQNAESFYLFIDVQSCPFTCFDMKYKKKLFSAVSKDGFSDAYKSDFNKFNSELLQEKYSFTEWEINLDNILNRLLTKKARSHYDR